MNARRPITVTSRAARTLCAAALSAAFVTAVAQPPRTPAPAPTPAPDATARGGNGNAPAGTPRRAPTAPAAPAPFTPSEKVSADTAVRFPVDI